MLPAAQRLARARLGPVIHICLWGKRHRPGYAGPPASTVSGMSRRLVVPLAVVLCGVALCLFPWFGDFFGIRYPPSYELRLVMRAMILVIVVTGLNILVGLSGMVSLGQAALF